MAERPNCYGQEWAIACTECTGGYDAAHLDPTNGSHIRPRCELFDECGRVMRERSQNIGLRQYPAQPQQQVNGQPYGYQQQYGRAAPNFAAPAAVRPAAPYIPPPRYPPVPQPYYPQPQQPYYPPSAQPMQYPAQPQQQQPYFGVQAPMLAPQVELMPRNWFAVPQVLAQHEPREQRPAASFLVEVLRGTGMITGLIAADFFSNISLLRKGE